MMHRQSSFAELQWSAKNRKTRRERFLNELDAITPWEELLQVIAPHYPKGDRGRPPKGLERMMRMYVAQQCLGLSDEGIEDALYDSYAVRQFVGVDLGADEVPDATTLLKFRRLLEAHDLTRAIFEAINAQLRERGLMMRQGTIVDATLIAAPSSTKNARGERDPEMHQTKKGNQWYFVRCAHPAYGGTAGLRQRPAAPAVPGGMKAHVGVDAETGLVHMVVPTAANVNDVTQAHRLLHGQEREVYADAGDPRGGQARREPGSKGDLAHRHAARQAAGAGPRARRLAS